MVLNGFYCVGSLDNMIEIGCMYVCMGKVGCGEIGRGYILNL